MQHGDGGGRRVGSAAGTAATSCSSRGVGEQSQEEGEVLIVESDTQEEREEEKEKEKRGGEERGSEEREVSRERWGRREERGKTEEKIWRPNSGPERSEVAFCRDRPGPKASRTPEGESLREEEDEEAEVKFVFEQSERGRRRGQPEEFGRSRRGSARSKPHSSHAPFWARSASGHWHQADACSSGGSQRNLGEGRSRATTGGFEVCQKPDVSEDVGGKPEGGYDNSFQCRPLAPRSCLGGHGLPPSTVESPREDQSGSYLAECGKVGTGTRPGSPDQLSCRTSCSTKGDEVRRQREARRYEPWRKARIWGKRKERETRGEGKWKRKEERRLWQGCRYPCRLKEDAPEAEGVGGGVPPVRSWEDAAIAPVMMGEILRRARLRLMSLRKKVTRTRRASVQTSPDRHAVGRPHKIRRFNETPKNEEAPFPQPRVQQPSRGNGAFLGAATPGPDVKFSNQPTSASKKEEADCVGPGLDFKGIVEWLEPRLEGFLKWRCETLPTGRLFPLPSSCQVLTTVFPDLSREVAQGLRCVVMGLNSLNGEGLDHNGSVSPLQSKVLKELVTHCERAMKWNAPVARESWTEFFRTRGIDYKGEEVKSALPIQWENVAPALPGEVGQVALEEVTELGCLHYVSNFREYLLPEADQVWVKPPKVMVAPEHWECLASNLIKSGIARAIHEDEIFRVQGHLLLNGLFGVSKDEFCNGFEVRRLIMNLIPLNSICRGLEGDVATLPSWAGMSALQLEPCDDLLVSSEDVRCFFYIFRVPPSWHGYLAFARPLPQSLSGSKSGTYYLCSTVLPMGFKNSVSLAQHVHRYVVKHSLKLSPGVMGLESEIRKDRHFPSSSGLFRIYLDISTS